MMTTITKNKSIISTKLCREIDEIKAKRQIPVRLAAYNSNGEFQGYKEGNFIWHFANLGEGYFTAYPMINNFSCPAGEQLTNSLVGLLNSKYTDQEEKKLLEKIAYVVAEQVNSDLEFMGGLLGYSICFDKDKQEYIAA